MRRAARGSWLVAALVVVAASGVARAQDVDRRSLPELMDLLEDEKALFRERAALAIAKLLNGCSRWEF